MERGRRGMGRRGGCQQWEVRAYSPGEMRGNGKKRGKRGSLELKDKGRGPRDREVGCENETSQRVTVTTSGRGKETGGQTKRLSSQM